jgi:hypothetical protein
MKDPCLKIGKYKKLFVGKGQVDGVASNKKFIGNSLLVDLGSNNYICIGREIFKFKTESPVLQFVSPVVGSDVPYPYAITKNNVYLTLEKRYYTVEQVDSIRLNVPMDNDMEPYMKYYGHPMNKCEPDSNDKKIHKLWLTLYPKKMHTKVLIKRF